MTDQPKIAETVARLNPTGFGMGMEEDPQGAWVSFTDYEALARDLAAERDRAEKAVASLALVTAGRDAHRADRDRLAAELAEARATITQMTAAWGEDAVTVEGLRKELAEAREALETQRAALRQALVPVPEIDLPLQPYGDTP